MIRAAALLLSLLFAITPAVAGGGPDVEVKTCPVPPGCPNPPMEDFVAETIAEYEAAAYQPTRVFVHLENRNAPHSAPTIESMIGGVIGMLQLSCNPMWAEDCRLPMGELVQMLRDAGAQAVAVCAAPTLDELEECLPGFGVLPSINGEQLYLDLGGPL